MLLTTPLAMLTGEISRRVNYPGEPKSLFLVERRYSWLLPGLGVVAFFWGWWDPFVLRRPDWSALIYLAMVLGLPFIATIISYFGGLLAFPLAAEKD